MIAEKRIEQDIDKIGNTIEAQAISHTLMLPSLYKLIHEYPLGGKPPMMTHIFENKMGERIIAAKGAPEAIIAVSNLTDIQKDKINKAIQSITSEGYRVLAVGRSYFIGIDNY